MTRLFQIAFMTSVAWTTAGAQTTPFVSSLYPIMEAAGCRNCHNPEGVASATRLRFPDKDTPLPRIEAFGRSLVELVDRDHPEKSLLFVKPTARIAHTGGERIPQMSAEEGILKTWVEYLAKLSGPELEAALRYKQEEAAGHGVAATAVLAATHQQPVQQYGARSSQELPEPCQRLSARRFRQWFQEPVSGAAGLSHFDGSVRHDRRRSLLPRHSGEAIFMV